jgi:hypothetical protein
MIKNFVLLKQKHFVSTDLSIDYHLYFLVYCNYDCQKWVDYRIKDNECRKVIGVYSQDVIDDLNSKEDITLEEIENLAYVDTVFWEWSMEVVEPGRFMRNLIADGYSLIYKEEVD